MQKYQLTLEKIDRRKIAQEFDRVIIVLADEGRGKSTLMLESIYYWEKEIKDRAPTIDDCLDRVVWSEPDELREKMASLPRESCLAVMDAGRLLNRKEAMKTEQVELEKDLFDARAFGHVLLLGFQSPQTVPDDLGGRRAKNLIHLPRRGRLHGYNRSSMNEYEWEDPDDLEDIDTDLEDSFPALDGTDLWDEFREIDLEKKRERISPDEDDDDSPAVAKVIAPDVRDELSWYLSQDERNGELYLDSDMITLEFDVTQREAEQTRKLLKRDGDVQIEADRALVDGEVVHEVDLEDDEEDEDVEESSQRTVEEIANDVYDDLSDYIGKDGRTGDFMLDPDLIAAYEDVSSRKARQVRKLVNRFEDVSIGDDVVSVGGEVVASKSRDV